MFLFEIGSSELCSIFEILLRNCIYIGTISPLSQKVLAKKVSKSLPKIKDKDILYYCIAYYIL